jgi:hypothetical protein
MNNDDEVSEGTLSIKAATRRKVAKVQPAIKVAHDDLRKMSYQRATQKRVAAEEEEQLDFIDPKGPTSWGRRTVSATDTIAFYSKDVSLKNKNLELAMFKAINSAPLNIMFIVIVHGFGHHHGKQTTAEGLKLLWQPRGILEQLYKKGKIDGYRFQQNNPGATVIHLTPRT